MTDKKNTHIGAQDYIPSFPHFKGTIIFSNDKTQFEEEKLKLRGKGEIFFI